MSVRNLPSLFKPQSVAVIGASNTPDTVGNIVMRNLLAGGFAGPIMPVTRSAQAVQGVLAYPDVASLPLTPELAVVVIPAAEVPAVVDDLGKRGTRAVVIGSAGLSKAENADGRTLMTAVDEIARKYGMRILGPNSMGLMVPGAGLNASSLHLPARKGRLAFVSQSGALCASVLDWAHTRGIGFSHFLSIGEAVNTDFGDILDFLGSDPQTAAILLYIQSVKDKRSFLSAARAAARNKPVLAIKAGRHEAVSHAVASHTGALAGSDHVYDAVFRRAGMLRVYDFEELFAAVETLGRSRKLKGDRLAIVTNGGGVGIMATDDLIGLDGRLATLTEDTIAKLDAVLPGIWSRTNPIDLIGDAPPDRYLEALKILHAAKEVDAVLVMHVPVAMVDATAVAEAVIAFAKEKRTAHITTCWVGDEKVREARRLFAEAAVPTLDTPDKAVRAFMHTVEYKRNQELLMETPASVATDFMPATVTARMIIEDVLKRGDTLLSEPEAKAVLAAYGIPTVETHIAKTPDEVFRQAERLGHAVAIKIISPDIAHKSDVGGVVLDLATPDEARQAAAAMAERLRRTFPEARIDGFSVQTMARRPGAHELIVGMSTDPVFGPVVLFGQGGIAVEVIGDRAVGLPPLNTTLAKELIGRTRVSRLLEGYRGRPPADLESISRTLIQVAQLATDIPEIVELDINPLFADATGVLAIDARMRVERTTQSGPDRLAIRPYPKDLEEVFTMRNGRPVLLRPIRPEDEPNHHAFVAALTPEDIRFRFFGLVQELPHSQMARLTQIDYDREMAFVGVATTETGDDETLGVVRTVTDPDNETAEFSIVVRSNLKGSGLGVRMMEKMIEYCRGRGTRYMVGQVLKENHRMLAFVEHLGFKRTATIDIDIVEVTLDLQNTPVAAPFTG
ncbi:bifunctional acetate--CoA ligase family protein/GNAT family N-acetyltransferase [Caenispirillum bisanense]|uniref:Acetyltransferase n=1 Tax=Caenispirillum bisanense TaxID=414052 RepID=A0A286H1D9_9PROT|nr:bifunctional acetate--CoA ligase family protein/GNAT family N-acetyltransferase [Caenispirillum bisanense]SOE01169.1 acetyltransferase [Caenispirillum bisanense]